MEKETCCGLRKAKEKQLYLCSSDEQGRQVLENYLEKAFTFDKNEICKLCLKHFWADKILFAQILESNQRGKEAWDDLKEDGGNKLDSEEHIRQLNTKADLYFLSKKLKKQESN